MEELATDRLALPLLASGQAGKEVTHNESLALLDIAAQAVVVSAGPNTPPPTPQTGQCWIVGDQPGGAWTGRARALAGWTGGGWRFVAPFAGFAVWNLATGRRLRFDGAAWVDGVETVARVEIDGQQVVGARRPAIAAPSGGGVIDAQARAALAEILAALRAHGLIAA